MEETYFVPFQEAEAEYVEKRSRFIGHIWRVDSEEEARARIEQTRKRHYDARHNCWCYLLREGGVLRYSDDGEPQGTAGQPMLNVFQREGVFSVCCVVTRYFGGILLGAGGLVRAYGGTAKAALNAAGLSRMQRWATLLIPCTYPLYERMRLLAEGCGGVIEDTDYGADITLTVTLPAQRRQELVQQVAELSAGSLEPILMEEAFRPGPREKAKSGG